MTKNVLHRFADVRHFVFDVDGVLTDSNLLLTENGELLRTMNTRDGYALKAALHQQFSVLIITGGESDGVRKRLSRLGVSNIHTGIEDKLTVFREIIQANQWDPTQILYMGDDLPDLEIMREVAIPCCPADAAEEIKALSVYTSPHAGGRGCVRDIIEKVLKIQGKWGI
jgi:3-deoxy-D-manno-octulosonate 8-phosphate phosphatase (KDO 8-P phosphatase)